MPLSVREFEDGVAFWRGTSWPPDFHNRTYEVLAATNPHGRFDLDWWVPFLKHLASWGATRTKSLTDLTLRAEERFDVLGATWLRSVEPLDGNDILGVQWDQVEGFPLLVAEIKNVKSPVFTSKFCHFLAPKIFPVTDNRAMGLPRFRYAAHYELVKGEWADTSDSTKESLEARMIERIGDEPFEGYPMVNKVVELCLIGRYQARRR